MEAAEKYGFKTYWPTVFLSEYSGLQKYVKMIRNDIVKELSTPISSKCAAIRVRSTLRAYLSAFAAGISKNGISFAVSQTDSYIQKAADLLKAEDMERDQKIHFYNYYRTQILSMLQSK
jgi:hypothetical protein